MNKKCIYTILKDINLITEYYHGQILIEDVIDLKKKLFVDNKYHPEFNIIMDFRDARAVFDKSGLMKYISFGKENLKYTGQKNIAFLTSKPNEVVLGTIFEKLNDELPFNTKLFSTLEAAMSWLNLNYSSLERIRETIIKLANQLHDV